MGLMSLVLSILGAILRMMAAMGSLISFAVSQGASLGKAEKAAIKADKKTPSASYERNQLAASTLAVLRHVFLTIYALACGCLAWCFAVPAMIMFLTGFACLLVSAAWKGAKLCWSFACVAFKMAAIFAVAVLCAIGLLTYAGYVLTWLCRCVLGYRGAQPNGGALLNILVHIWMFGYFTGLDSTSKWTDSVSSASKPADVGTTPVDSAPTASCSPDASAAAARDASLPSVRAPSDNTTRPMLQLNAHINGRFSDDCLTDHSRDIDRGTGATPTPATASPFPKAPASALNTHKGAMAGNDGAAGIDGIDKSVLVAALINALGPILINFLLTGRGDMQATPVTPASAQPVEMYPSSTSGAASSAPHAFDRSSSGGSSSSSSLSSLGAGGPGVVGFYRQGSVGFVKSRVAVIEAQPPCSPPIACGLISGAAAATTNAVVAAAPADVRPAGRVGSLRAGSAVVGGVVRCGGAAKGLRDMVCRRAVLQIEQATLSAEFGQAVEWLAGPRFAAK